VAADLTGNVMIVNTGSRIDLPDGLLAAFEESRSVWWEVLERQPVLRRHVRSGYPLVAEQPGKFALHRWLRVAPPPHRVLRS
jgi:hypothetical protein